jgi:hypothetical protein
VSTALQPSSPQNVDDNAAFWGYWGNDPAFTLLPGTRTIVLQEDLWLIDRRSRVHRVPKGFASDGNSAPPWTYSIFGDRLTPAYRRASVVHDWYCHTHGLPAREAHQLYYEALRATDVLPITAAIFHTAVSWKNPEWTDRPHCAGICPVLLCWCRRHCGPTSTHRATRPEAAMITTVQTLDELLTVLQAAPASDDSGVQMEFARAHGLRDAHGLIDMASLPTFGGDEPRSTNGVWSWDATRLLVGESAADLTIVSRDEWARDA